MKKKRSLVIIFVGLLFIVMGIYSLGMCYSLQTSDWKKYTEGIDLAVQHAISSFDVYQEEEHQQKLIESGNLEEFEKESRDFKNKLLSRAEEYKTNIPKQNRVIAIISSLAGILCLISGFGLIRHFAWSRKISFISIFGVVVYYSLIWRALYPILYMVQFLEDGINKFSLLYDPTCADLSETARYFGLNQSLFVFPLVMHVFVLAISIGIIYYLSRPRVIEKLQ